jgi:hypothetical protein
MSTPGTPTIASAFAMPAGDSVCAITMVSPLARSV